MRIKYILLAIYSLLTLVLYGQGTFEEKRDIHGQHNVFSGSVVAVADINNDYLDDVVLLEDATILTIAYQHPFRDTLVRQKVGRVNADGQWSMTVADLDRNGWRDIIIAGAYDGVKVYYQDNQVFTLKRFIDPNFYAQAMNAIDIDNDGWTDLFVCNDDSYNVIFWNRQGDLIPDTIGVFSILNEKDAQGNYGSSWTDIDNDGDQDLYISKCSAQSKDSTDLRRVNQLFINLGNGQWSEEAVERGVASGAQSWASDFGDIDGDGDMDLLVNNHDRPSQLLVNDGNGFFSDITRTSGVLITGAVIQGLFSDVNEDGYPDIIISGSKDFVYLNDRDLTFSEVTHPFDIYDIVSFAEGDLNNDGHLDCYATYTNLINEPSVFADRAWLKNSVAPSYLEVHLKGTLSNTDGIGARVTLFTDKGIQIHECRAGESYGIHNSFIQHFSLRLPQRLDSLVINWPSGLVQVVKDLSPADRILVVEGQFDVKLGSREMPRKQAICSSDSLTLEGPLGFSYRWSDGLDNQVRTIHQKRFYQLSVSNDGNTFYALPGSVIDVDPVPRAGIEIVVGDSINCMNDQVFVRGSGGVRYTWIGGGRGEIIEVTEDTEVQVVAHGKCNNDTSKVAEVKFNRLPVLKPTNDTIVIDGPATLTAGSPLAHWYRDSDLNELIHVGDSLDLSFIDRDSTFWVRSETNLNYGTFTVGESDPGEEGRYHDENLNSIMFFHVSDDVFIESVDVYSEFEGPRSIILYDPSGQIIYENLFEIDSGMTTLHINIALERDQGFYGLGTNDSINMNVWGHRSPKLLSAYNGIDYPYGPSDVIRLYRSRYGLKEYPYFFNWKCRKNDRICSGPIDSAQVIRSLVSVKENHQSLAFRLVPNPCKENTTLYFDTKFTGEITLWSPLGKKAGHWTVRDIKQILLDTGYLPRGTYYLIVRNKNFAKMTVLIMG